MSKYENKSLVSGGTYKNIYLESGVHTKYISVLYSKMNGERYIYIYVLVIKHEPACYMRFRSMRM